MLKKREKVIAIFRGKENELIKIKEENNADIKISVVINITNEEAPGICLNK